MTSSQPGQGADAKDRSSMPPSKPSWWAALSRKPREGAAHDRVAEWANSPGLQPPK